MTDIDAAIAMLSSVDTALRHEAIEAIGETGERRGIGPLVALLRDCDLGTRDAAVNTLISIGGAEVADAVLPLLYEEDDAALRNMAVEILERLGGFGVSAVIPLLSEKDEDVLKFAIDTIGRCVLSSAPPDVNGAAASLTRLCGHPNPNIRASTAITLAKLRAFSSVQSLIEMLKDDDEWVRFSVLEALGSIGSPDIIDRLLSAVERDDMSRLAAIDALSNLVHEDDAKKVMPFIENRDISFAISTDTAVRFMERLGGSLEDRDKEVFLDILKARLGYGSIEEKRQALSGIRLLKYKGAIPALVAFAADLKEG
ncbi:MAG: HEAT repeat domain-containing protein, partial [Deltaproteobacteria bacterium]|nr:HEAT repeat domain-containing protein [Deltaproteobacteria bacterium]